MRDQCTPGLCICGCGQPAPIATKTRNDRGQIRGQAMKLIPGHKKFGPRITFICEHCLQSFQRKPGYVRAKPVRFCSAECREASKKRGPVLINETTAHVPLTQGMVAVIDASDVEKVSRFTWYASHAGDGRFYAKGHMQDGRNDYLHRFILNFPDSEVDHRDGDTLNNHRSNLRLATSSQNKENRSAWLRRSLPKGVYLTKSGRYEAKLAASGRRVFIGVFDTPEDAARAYDEAAILHFGEFARLNFPD